MQTFLKKSGRLVLSIEQGRSKNLPQIEYIRQNSLKSRSITTFSRATTQKEIGLSQTHRQTLNRSHQLYKSSIYQTHFIAKPLPICHWKGSQRLFIRSLSTESHKEPLDPPPEMKTTQPNPKENSALDKKAWIWDKIVLCTIFAITGSSTMYFVKPLLSSVLGLEGSLFGGPLSYQLCYVFLMTPCYSLMLLTVGHIFQRGAWAKMFVRRMWSPLFRLVSRITSR